MPLEIRVFWFGECRRLGQAQGGSAREGSCNEAATARHGGCSRVVACEASTLALYGGQHTPRSGNLLLHVRDEQLIKQHVAS